MIGKKPSGSAVSSSHNNAHGVAGQNATAGATDQQPQLALNNGKRNSTTIIMNHRLGQASSTSAMVR